MKESNVYKAHGGLLTTVHIFDVAMCESNGFYRGFLNNVLCNVKLNKKEEEKLIGDGNVSVVRIVQLGSSPKPKLWTKAEH